MRWQRPIRHQPTHGPHFWFLPPAQLPASDAALRRSGALHIAEELVAPRTLDLSLDHIQIALNYPRYDHRPGGPHVDGHRPDQQRPDSFTMLAAIYLVDEQETQAGNLWVWPGSHLDHQRLFQQRGPRTLLPVSGHSTMLDPPPALRKQVPVLASPRRPASGRLPSRPQHRRQYDRSGPAHRLLPAGLPGSRGPVGGNIPRRLRRVLASASPARQLTTAQCPYAPASDRATTLLAVLSFAVRQARSLMPFPRSLPALEGLGDRFSCL